MDAYIGPRAQMILSPEERRALLTGPKAARNSAANARYLETVTYSQKSGNDPKLFIENLYAAALLQNRPPLYEDMRYDAALELGEGGIILGDPYALECLRELLKTRPEIMKKMDFADYSRRFRFAEAFKNKEWENCLIVIAEYYNHGIPLSEGLLSPEGNTTALAEEKTYLHMEYLSSGDLSSCLGEAVEQSRRFMGVDAAVLSCIWQPQILFDEYSHARHKGEDITSDFNECITEIRDSINEAIPIAFIAFPRAEAEKLMMYFYNTVAMDEHKTLDETLELLIRPESPYFCKEILYHVVAKNMEYPPKIREEHFVPDHLKPGLNLYRQARKKLITASEAIDALQVVGIDDPEQLKALKPSQEERDNLLTIHYNIKNMPPEELVTLSAREMSQLRRTRRILHNQVLQMAQADREIHEYLEREDPLYNQICRALHRQRGD